ncbi:putative MFS family arabinose efflux permease [Streptomyces achromogenes]|uniref:MFS family arabinose efflux permease n=1 Tax=Streptomyces achromogenes TaxID=67255 RepID=A0ABU0PW05_STRAH|nr:MFS transporter [Streptomyces achromogenes]MDQ0681823.1 putative MFS family arabinose efflux permease [Streptomyces achromogenes]
MSTDLALWTRLRDVLMLQRRETRLLLASVTADSFGTGIFTATSVLFFTTVRGFSVSAVGLAISLGSLCAFFLGPRIGALADRVGPQKSLIVLFGIRAVGYGLYLLAEQYWLFVMLACVVTTADRASPAINQALMGRLFEAKDRATILGTVFSARNGAIVLGSLAATLPVVTGSSALYLVGIGVNAASFIVAALLVGRLHVPKAEPAAAGRDKERRGEASPLRDRRYLAITVVNGVAQTHNTILSLVLPLWIVHATSSPKWSLTALLALNGALAMAAQVPVNRMFADFSAALRASALGGVAVCAACLAYAGAGAVGDAWVALAILVVAMLAHTAGESLFIASTPLSFELAPKESLGRYLSFYNLGRVGQDLVGPLLIVGPLVDRGTPVWLLVGVVVLLGGLVPWALLKDDALAANGRPAR